MNKRIKELAIQVQRTEMPGVLFAHPEFVEKFAKLIVRECLDQLLINDPAEDFDKGIAWSAKAIQEHFGVE